MQLKEIYSNKGCYHAKHHNPGEESIGYVIKGRLKKTIGDREYILSNGDCWYHPDGVFHWTRALEDTYAVEIHSPPRPEEDYYGSGGPSYKKMRVADEGQLSRRLDRSLRYFQDLWSFLSGDRSTQDFQAAYLSAIRKGSTQISGDLRCWWMSFARDRMSPRYSGVYLRPRRSGRILY